MLPARPEGNCDDVYLVRSRLVSDMDHLWKWLSGDARGLVSPKFENPVTEKRENTLGTPYDQGRAKLRRIAQANLLSEPVLLQVDQAQIVFGQFQETAAYRGWTLVACAAMANHIHILDGVSGDPEPSDLLRDFKSYASRALNRQLPKPASGTWWTEQGSMRKVKDATHFANVIRYIAQQANPLLIWIHPELEDKGERGASAPCLRSRL